MKEIKDYLVAISSTLSVAAVAAGIVLYADVEVLKSKVEHTKDLATVVQNIERQELATERAIQTLEKTVDRLVDRLEKLPRSE